MDSNIDHVDIIKGLGVIGLIMAHTLSTYLHYIGYDTEPHFEWSLFTFMIASARQLVDFIPPLFLLVSGYILSLRYTTSISNWQAFYKKRLLRMYLPLSVWLPVYYLMDGKFTLTKLIADIVFIRGSIHLWFVWAIVLVYLLFPVMLSFEKRFLGIGSSSVNHRRYLTILLILLAIFGVVNSIVPLNLTKSKFINYTLNHRILILPYSMFFFATGVYMARIGGTHLSAFLLPSRYRIPILALAACTASILPFFHRGSDSSFLHQTIRTMLYLLCLFSTISIVPVICSVITNTGNGLVGLIKQLGKSSYGIFLAHVAVLEATHGFIHVYFEHSPVACIFPLFLITTVVCCLPVFTKKKNSVLHLLGYS